MCGIAGVISRNNVDKSDVSSNILEMLSYIQHRGPDAGGIALFPDMENVLLRVAVNSMDYYDTLKEIVSQYGEIINEKLLDAKKTIPVLEFELGMDEDLIKKLHFAINEIDGLAVHSIGNGMKVYKDGGYISDLIEKHQIENEVCSHGIGHVRMATESAEDINAAHPFVSPLYPELAIVHNGQFTNYFKLRRFLESKGAKFKTMNDSEAASHLIAYALKENDGDLKKALDYAFEHMDGVFCVIAATKNQMGFVKDKLGIKPLLVVESDDYILLGSEQIEFNAISKDVNAIEMEPGEVCVWNI